MAYFDLPLDELRRHTTGTQPPDDLEDFWRQTLDTADRVDVAATFCEASTPLRVVETLDVTYAGYGGEPVRAWLHLPRGHPDPMPCVVEYIGYGGGRGLSHRNVFWATAGFAHLVMDTRGQGGGWSVGHTPDVHGSDPSYSGFMTRGVLDPAEYYYRRLYVDAVRAVDAARSHPRIDPQRVAVSGGSQGGGLSLAVAALRPDVAACCTEVPFLADIARATRITDAYPYQELAQYLKVHRDRVAAVSRTLSYFDVAVLGRWATAPALFSVGLMDDVCPPSTVYAAYNAYGGPKEIVEYDYNAHDGGGEFHQVAMVEWLRAILG